ncbi:MAG: hypothetical protein ABGW90_07130, partial [Martelella sp.]
DELHAFIETDVEPMAIDVGERLGVQDPQSLIDRFETTHEKWRQLLADVDRDDTDALKTIFREQIFANIDVSTYGTN